MFRTFSAIVLCVSIGFVSTAKVDAQVNLPDGPLNLADGTTRMVHANAPTDDWPTQEEGKALVKKLSAIVNGQGTSQAKPQTPIQMEPLVVIGTRPKKSEGTFNWKNHTPKQLAGAAPQPDFAIQDLMSRYSGQYMTLKKGYIVNSHSSLGSAKPGLPAEPSMRSVQVPTVKLARPAVSATQFKKVSR